MSDGPSEKALQEFLSEAQEIVEQFNRDLLALDEQRDAGHVRSRGHQRRLPRRALAQGAVGPLRRHAHDEPVAQPREPARQLAPRARRAAAGDARSAVRGGGAVQPHHRRDGGGAGRRRRGQPRRGSDRAARSRGAAQGDGAGVVAVGRLGARRVAALGADRVRRAPAAREHQGRALALSHPRGVRPHDDRQGARRAQGAAQAHRRGHHLSAVGGGGERSADRARRDPRRAGRAAHGARGGGGDRRRGGAVAAAAGGRRATGRRACARRRRRP